METIAPELSINQMKKKKKKTSHTMEAFLMGRLSASSGTGRGMRGEPTTLSSSCSSALRPARLGADALSGPCALIHMRKFCHRRAVLLPMLVNISSGMGTSRTVSRPSSLSKFGQSFLMEGKERRKGEHLEADFPFPLTSLDWTSVAVACA